MNLVDQVKTELPTALIDRMSSLIGAGEGATKSAVGAAVPALLQGLSNVAHTGNGAQRLASALGKFDADSVGDTANMLANNPGAVQEQGSGLLNSLFGGNIVSGLSNTLSRVTGLGAGAVQKLLGYLTPMVLGVIAGRFAGRTPNAQSVTHLLDDQKANIENALPSGVSLRDVPGAAAGAAARAAAGAAQDTASSVGKWLIPLLLLAALALAAYLLWPKSKPTVPEVPAVADVTTNVTNTVQGMTDSLNGITDPTSAAASLGKLAEFNTKIDQLKETMAKLPAEGKAKVAEAIKTNLDKLETQYAKLLWIPGVGDKIGNVMNESMNKLASLGGLPAPELPRLSGDVSRSVTSLTETLGGIKDSASAEAVLPKLNNISKELDSVKDRMGTMSDTAKSTLGSLIKAAVAKLRPVVDKVLAMAGVGEKVKPVVDGILAKLDALTG